MSFIDKTLYPALFDTTTSKYGLLAGSSGINGTGSMTVNGGVYGTSGSITATVNGTAGSNTPQALIELSSLFDAANALSNTGGNYNGSNFTFYPNVYDSSLPPPTPSIVENVTFIANSSTDQFVIRNFFRFEFGSSTTFTFIGPVNVNNIFWVSNQEVGINTSQVKGVIVSNQTYVTGGTIDGQVFATQQIYITTLNTIDVPLCYLKGTKILTNQGYIAIEHLRKGDRVVTGGKIINHKTVVKEDSAVDTIVWCGKIPSTVKHAPICIKADAFEPGTPFEDLWVSPGHGIILKDQLEFVQHHLKSETIFQDEDAPTDEYYHVKLSSHQVIYANGVASESLNFNIEDYLA